MSREIIGVDIDDVLVVSAEGFIAFSNQNFGTSLTINDYTEHWAEMWRVDMEETERRAKVFHESDAVLHYDTQNDARIVLENLHETYDLYAFTSRRLLIDEATRSWLDVHFPDVFDAVHYAGIFDGPLEEGLLQKTKSDLFSSHDVRYVIDDQLKHCMAAAELGIRALLFGNYNWNQVDTLPQNIERVHNWKEVQKYFDEQ